MLLSKLLQLLFIHFIRLRIFYFRFLLFIRLFFLFFNFSGVVFYVFYLQDKFLIIVSFFIRAWNFSFRHGCNYIAKKVIVSRILSIACLVHQTDVWFVHVFNHVCLIDAKDVVSLELIEPHCAVEIFGQREAFANARWTDPWISSFCTF